MANRASELGVVLAEEFVPEGCQRVRCGWGLHAPNHGRPGRGAVHAPERGVMPARRGVRSWGMQPPTASTVSCDGLGGSGGAICLAVQAQCVLDPSRELVHGVGVLTDRVQGAVFAPARDVGDGLATDVEAG